MIKQVPVNVEAATYDMAGHLCHLVQVLEPIVKAGTYDVTIVSALISAAIVDLAPAIKDVSAIPGDLAENKAAFVMAFMAQAEALWEALP